MRVRAWQLANANAYVRASAGVTVLFLMILATAGLIYALGAFDPARPTLYKRLLAEDGPVEWLTAILLVAAAVIAIVAAFKLPETLRWARPFLILFSIFSLLMSLEEVSWGQRIMGIETTEFFSKHNDQDEINAHNVVSRYLATKSFPIRKTREIAAIVLCLRCHSPDIELFQTVRLDVQAIEADRTTSGSDIGVLRWSDPLLV